MAVTVANQWTSIEHDRDHEIPVTPADGNWLVAIVSWLTVDGTSPGISVGDLRRNLWSLARTVDHPSAGLHQQVWVCPNIKTYGVGTNVYVAASFIGAVDVGTVDVDVVEFAGLSNYVQFDVVPIGTTTAGTVLSITTATPGGSSLMLAAIAIDNAARTISVTSAGWTNLTTVTDTDTPGLRQAAMWQAGAVAAKTGAWSLSGSANAVGLIVAIREVGAAPTVTPDWGGAVALEVQLALGYDQSTPVSAMRWRTLSSIVQYLRTQRGLPAELSAVETAESTAGWINDDGALTPRPAGTAVVVAAGTTTTAPISDADAGGFVLGDFARLQTYAGVLREDTVFQVNAKSSSNGVTTLGLSPAAAAAPALGDVLVGVPVDAFTPVRALATVEGKTYPVTVGASEAIPQTWLDGTHGRVDMSIADAYASMTGVVPPVLDGEVLRGNPYAYWPLDDPSGSGRAANASPRSSAPLVQTISKFGAGSGAADFGATVDDVPQTNSSDTNTSSLTGAGSASGWSQSGLVTADSTEGYALVATDDGFPPISGGVTIIGCSLINAAPYQPSGDPTVVIIRNGDPGISITGNTSAGSIIKLAADSSAQAAVTVWDKDTHASTRTLATPLIANSGWVPWALTFNRTSWTVYANGTFSSGGTCDLVDSFSLISFGGEADGFYNGHSFNGSHAKFAVYDRILSPTEIDNIHRAAAFGMSRSTTIDGTIRRQLARASWPGARILCRSDIKTSEDVGLEGSAVGEVVAGISKWEDGLLWVDAAGYLQYRSRDQLDRTTEKFVLGPNTGAGEIPYLAAPDYDADGKLLYTEVDVVNTGKLSVAATYIFDGSGTFPAVAATSEVYGSRPLPWPTHLSEAEDVYGLGQWVVSRYARPQLRIRQVQIDPRAAAGTTGWHAILGLEVADVIRVKWAPGAAPALSTRYVVVGILHDASPSRWIATLTLMTAPQRGLILDDASVGVLSAGTVAL